MKALIFENRVVDIVEKEFEVPETMTWMDCTDECTTFWTLEKGVLTPPSDPVENVTYAEKRQGEYPSIDDLVVALYDTDDKAAIDEKRAAVKKKYPKPS